MNHFIELQRSDTGEFWAMIHSGSRNLGKKVADHYNKIAVDLNARWHSAVPKSWELAFLPLLSAEGQDYVNEMQYCVEFAKANRAMMMKLVVESIVDITEVAIVLEPIDVAHNYARMEHHFNQDVMIHRKGATSAREGEIGIIPGSQGTASYIVRGLGNPESFTSCSHGAGRKMGRMEAKRSLNLAEQIALMDAQGIVHGIRTTADLDEASGAYKLIEEVMENQKDLVEPIVKLKPLAVIKG